MQYNGIGAHPQRSDRMQEPRNAFASSSKMKLDSHIEEFEDISDLEDVNDYDTQFLAEFAKAEEDGAQSPVGEEPSPRSRESPISVLSTQARKESDFQRYLAGQSVMKSGLTRDQAEVNRIIAEASKNSKFFLREKVKDEQLNKRIEALMKKVCRVRARLLRN